MKIKKLDITSHPPYVYAWAYFANVILFSALYFIGFSAEFKNEPINLIQSIYFSVVTVTTLGYGDITPKLGSSLLLLTITTQVVLGVINIGLFLNAISQKLSDRKDALRNKNEKEIEDKNTAKLLTILKPVFISHLEIMSETYKVTTTEEDGFITKIPSELFNQNYFDQISRQNFLSNETRYGNGVMLWGQFIEQENNKFTSGIDDFLNKFATSLPMQLIEILVNLKSHRYLHHCNQAIQINQFNLNQGIRHPQINMLTIEHSSVDIPENEKPNSIKDFHEKFLRIITLLEEKTEGEKILMNIDLRKGVTAPNVGSAIGEIIKFGPFEH